MLRLAFPFLIAFLFSASSTFAVTFKVIGKNGEVLFTGENTEITLPQTAGQVTVGFLNANQIPFVGDIDGIVSINGLESDLELISDTDMKAWGWCYSVNGVVPDDFVHKVNILEQKTELVWFYAYAYYKAGAWVAQCVTH